MIDEKRLREILACYDPEYTGDDDATVREIKQALKLALWAKEYGIPALQTIELLGKNELHDAAKNALDELEKLPKELLK